MESAMTEDNKTAKIIEGTEIAEPIRELQDEQVVSISGGRVTFNPFSITRKIDKASPLFFG